MSFISINKARNAQDAPVSEDWGDDVVDDLDFLNGVNGSAVDAAGAPLILNGSFEISSNGVDADNWSFSAFTGGTGAVDLIDSDHGDQSFKFTRDNTAGHGGGTLVSSDFFNVNPQRGYLLQFDNKNNGTDMRNEVIITWYDNTQTSIGTTTVYDSNNGGVFAPQTSWNSYQFTVYPIAGAVFAKLTIIGGDTSVTPAATRSIRFDNVSCTPLFPRITSGAIYNPTGGGGSTTNLTVPQGIYRIKCKLWGGIAGGSLSNVLGRGYSEGFISVRPGQTLHVNVSNQNGNNTNITDVATGSAFIQAQGSNNMGQISFGGYINLATGTPGASCPYAANGAVQLEW